MADALLKCLPADYCTIRRDVTLQRDSTKRKSGIVEKILRILPYPLLDWMRMAESVLLSSANKEATPRLWTPTDSDRLPSRSMVERILVVDDAIDSGATLAGVVAGLKKEYPGADIKTAVMTVTTTNPMIFPDWTLFAGDTLLRFPWSADFKKKNKKLFADV